MSHADQAVVQYARRGQGASQQNYAIKFFLKRSDYNTEANMYRHSPMRFFMPSVVKYVDNIDNAAKDPFGGVLKPFVVMERGGSLQDRAQKSQVDIFTTFQACSPGATTKQCSVGCGIGIIAFSFFKKNLLPQELCTDNNVHSNMVVLFPISSCTCLSTFSRNSSPLAGGGVQTPCSISQREE